MNHQRSLSLKPVESVIIIQKLTSIEDINRLNVEYDVDYVTVTLVALCKLITVDSIDT